MCVRIVPTDDGGGPVAGAATRNGRVWLWRPNTSSRLFEVAAEIDAPLTAFQLGAGANQFAVAAAVAKYGTDWDTISDRAFQFSRSGLQCYDRWRRLSGKRKF